MYNIVCEIIQDGDRKRLDADKVALDKWLQKQKLGKVKLTIKKFVNDRSAKQNKYWWKFLNEFAKHLYIEHGLYNNNSKALAEGLKTMFGFQIEVDGFEGRKIENISTTQLKVDEMQMLIKKSVDYAKDKFDFDSVDIDKWHAENERKWAI